MGAEHVPGYLIGHFSDEVSKTTLAEILTLIGHGRRVALLGFSDYTKHIINNFGDNVVKVFEVDQRFAGFEFREKKVEHIDRISEYADEFDDFIVCVFNNLVDYTEAVQRAGLAHKPMLWPENFDGHRAHRYDVRRQSSLYRYTPGPDRLGEPATMMPRETITFLTELLRASLRVAGEVAEVGVWQGGSGWNMAKMMQHIGDQRPIHLFDFFDDHTRTNPEAIMCLDEIRARFGFYEDAYFYRGYADQHMGKLSDRQFCFVHIDLGYIPEIMEFFWSRLNEGGVMVLDNYGHVRSWPTEFDRFFRERGHSVVRVPFSYQAFIMK
jgi:hypothetical protein